MEIFNQILNSVSLPYKVVKNVNIEGHDPILPSPFLIGEAGAAAIAAIGYAAAKLWELKTGRLQTVSISVRDAAIAQRSHQYFRKLDGATPELWSPFSGFYQTLDNRWIQFHCNFPHHQQGVLDWLRCKEDKNALIEAVKKCTAEKLETDLSNQGLCAAMVRTRAEWEAHPQAKATNHLPLMEVIKLGDSKPKDLPKGSQPLSGVRVLDLSRVIAGPVCGKTFAEHGAEVLRIASPTLPFILPLVMDTGFGKRSAFIDLHKTDEKNNFIQLIKDADIFLQAYRPGAFSQLGFSPAAVKELNPNIIYIELSAYAREGPWAMRHGFDSLVQSATGIVDEQSMGKAKPEHLPAQSLDYITGFLAAFGAMEALRRRATEGGSYLVSVSLEQTAHWFKTLNRAEHYQNCKPPTHEEIKMLLTQTQTAFGRLEHLLPVLKMSETKPHYSGPCVPLGTHEPHFKEK